MNDESLFKIPKLLQRLLVDHSTSTSSAVHNIFWATKDYEKYGAGYQYNDEIQPDAVSGENENIVLPRVKKTRTDQSARSKEMAEVYSPSWLCNKMNNTADEQWFGESDVFNTETIKDGVQSWQVNENKISFPEGKTWQDYVKNTRLEIACGEAPFLVSRYDTTTGADIPIAHRIGFLDRKMRVIKENTDTEKDWYEATLLAYKNVYGYEWQGDSLLLARKSLLFSFADYYEDKFNKAPQEAHLFEIANIISWNLWQMDGLKFVVPDSCHDVVTQTLGNLFEEPQTVTTPCCGCSSGNPRLHNGTKCKIMDWEKQQPLFFIDSLKIKGMKFDFVIGNPPYQEKAIGNNKNFTPSVFDKFLDAAFSISDKVEMIHPAKFLYNAGGTSDDWNEKMLNDEHFKVLWIEENSKNIFSGVDIKGGVAITYRDAAKDFGAIKVFTKFDELQTIFRKVSIHIPDEEHSLMAIIFTQTKFNLENMYASHPEMRAIIGSEGKDKRFRNNAFDKVPLFTESKQNDDDVAVLGLINNKRVWRFIQKEFVDFNHEDLSKWKVFVPIANGTGAFGQILSTPLIAEPLIAHTQSFIGIGCFSSKQEAEATLKYVKTKFARAMLGVLKATQLNNRNVWRYVPLQNFTPSSDIDWTKSVAEIDRQLYAKYGLDEKEINFIESKVKEME